MLTYELWSLNFENMDDLVINILSDFSGVSVEKIHDNSYLLDDLNLESLRFIDLLIEIEKVSKKKVDFTQIAFQLFEINDLTYSQIKVQNLKNVLKPYLLF